MKYKHNIGEKVLCFEPDETKARVLYNAKIMDADIVKDAKGKKCVEYKIHFQGWNHAWDRWAEETFVLKDNEQNRKLQRKLAKSAIKKLKLQKGKKRHHLPGVVNPTKEAGGEMLEGSSSDESIDSDFTRERFSESDEGEPPEKRYRMQDVGGSNFYREDVSLDQESVSSKDDSHIRRLALLDIPFSLQRRLEEDNVMITRRNMVVKLPLTPNVVQILENYVKHFAIHIALATEKNRFSGSSSQTHYDVLPPEKRLNLCQEVCSDLKLLFDYTLPLVLLYYPEREQFKSLMKTTRIGDRENRFEVKKQSDSSSKSVFKKLEFKDSLSKKKESLSPVDVESIKSETLVEIISELKEQTKTKRALSFSEDSETASSKTPLKQRSVSECVNSSSLEEPPRTPHKKKTAEEQLIEETHKYLIPNQPNLDQTGLSKDAQGRRRSSRLTHHEFGFYQSSSFSDTVYHRLGKQEKNEFQTKDLTPDAEKTPTKSRRSHSKGKVLVYINSHIFLRSSMKTKYPVPSSVHHDKESTVTSAQNSQTLFNAVPRMDQERYMAYAGNDVKKIVELTKTWNWSILHKEYQQESGVNVSPSLIYGIHHLLRLFVNLPDILAGMEIPDFKLRILVKHLNLLLKFLAEYERELFEVDSYVNFMNI